MDENRRFSHLKHHLKNMLGGWVGGGGDVVNHKTPIFKIACQSNKVGSILDNYDSAVQSCKMEVSMKIFLYIMFYNKCPHINI